MVVVIIMAVMVDSVYFLFQFAHDAFPVFAAAAIDVVFIFRGFYVELGIGATLGMIGFICLGFGLLVKKQRGKTDASKMMK